jgi:hypothetical protein
MMITALLRGVLERGRCSGRVLVAIRRIGRLHRPHGLSKGPSVVVHPRTIQRRVRSPTLAYETAGARLADEVVATGVVTENRRIVRLQD